jgi:hypothetical protein
VLDVEQEAREEQFKLLMGKKVRGGGRGGCCYGQLHALLAPSPQDRCLEEQACAGDSIAPAALPESPEEWHGVYCMAASCLGVQLLLLLIGRILV